MMIANKAGYYILTDDGFKPIDRAMGSEVLEKCYAGCILNKHAVDPKLILYTDRGRRFYVDGAQHWVDKSTLYAITDDFEEIYLFCEFQGSSKHMFLVGKLDKNNDERFNKVIELIRSAK